MACISGEVDKRADILATLTPPLCLPGCCLLALLPASLDTEEGPHANAFVSHWLNYMNLSVRCMQVAGAAAVGAAAGVA